MTVGGAPVTVVSGRQTCIEVGGDDAGGGSWCGPVDMPEAVWLGAISVGDDLVEVGQAPAEVVSVTLSGEDGPSSLAVEQTGQGQFFVDVDVRPGNYEVATETETRHGLLSVSTTTVPCCGAQDGYERPLVLSHDPRHHRDGGRYRRRGEPRMTQRARRWARLPVPTAAEHGPAGKTRML
jgi:hypothetical protein